MNNILIFGDSYSTFKDFVPSGYAIYYPREEFDVDEVFDTWWKRVIDSLDGNLLLNNSWSGSTIGYTGYGGADTSKTSSFIYRFRKLKEDGFFDKNKIDTVFVFGGTNDSWSNAPLGEKKTDNINEADLYFVIPAIYHFLKNLKETLPSSKIITVINTDIKEDIQKSLKNFSKELDISFVALSDIEKKNGHPTALGMKNIAEQIIESIKG